MRISKLAQMFSIKQKEQVYNTLIFPANFYFASIWQLFSFIFRENIWSA